MFPTGGSPVRESYEAGCAVVRRKGQERTAHVGSYTSPQRGCRGDELRRASESEVSDGGYPGSLCLFSGFPSGSRFVRRARNAGDEAMPRPVVVTKDEKKVYPFDK